MVPRISLCALLLLLMALHLAASRDMFDSVPLYAGGVLLMLSPAPGEVVYALPMLQLALYLPDYDAVLLGPRHAWHCHAILRSEGAETAVAVVLQSPAFFWPVNLLELFPASVSTHVNASVAVDVELTLSVAQVPRCVRGIVTDFFSWGGVAPLPWNSGSCEPAVRMSLSSSLLPNTPCW